MESADGFLKSLFPGSNAPAPSNGKLGGGKSKKLAFDSVGKKFRVSFWFFLKFSFYEKFLISFVNFQNKIFLLFSFNLVTVLWKFYQYLTILSK